MQERTNKRVQTITQNIDKVKGCKTKKRVASLQPSLITIALKKTKFTNPLIIFTILTLLNHKLLAVAYICTWSQDVLSILSVAYLGNLHTCEGVDLHCASLLSCYSLVDAC